MLEIVTKGRQPYPQMSSIYFVAPDRTNVEAVIADFTPPTVHLKSRRRGPAYADAHLFFSGEVPQELFQLLAGSPAAPHVRSLVETYLNFVALESRAYHLGGARRPLAALLREPPAGPPDAGLQAMAAQIVGACVTMNEAPALRYQRDSPAARQLATCVQERFDAYAQRNAGFAPARDGQLVIADRTVDLLAPLLHEFTLQAMATDLLPIEDGVRYSYNYASGDTASRRDVVLDENDALWTALRHSHIAEVSKEIIRRFNAFTSDNKAAQHPDAARVTDLKQLRDTMNDMAEFHELKAQYSLHLSVAQECLAVFEQRRLLEVARVEQNMAVGRDADGDPVHDVWAAMVALFDRPSLKAADRARLVALYLLTQPALADKDKRALFEHAKLGKPELEAVRQLALLAQRLPAPCSQRKPAAHGRRGARPSLLDADFPFDASRYVPALKIVLDDLAHGEAAADDEFPLLRPVPAGPATPRPSAAITSLRARPAAATSATARGSISAFVLGGLTYSEMRSAYELAQQHGRDFFVGGDRVLTPEAFLDALRQPQ